MFSFLKISDLFTSFNFLISEGYVQNEKEALSIMSESEFLEGFDEGMKQVINESSENNK